MANNVVTTRLLLLFLANLIMIVSTTIPATENSDRKPYAYKAGDIILGGLFPIHQYISDQNCGNIRETEVSLQLMQAMIFAIQRINKRNDLLPGIQLGFQIRDTCSRDTIALKESLLLLTRLDMSFDSSFSNQYQTLSKCSNTNRSQNLQNNQQKRIIGVIGPGSSRESVLVSDLLNIFQIPQISYSSTSDDLSKKERYKYFLRTVPRDYLQVHAIIDLCLHYNWSYVQFVYSEGSYGENGYKNFRSQISGLNLCIAAEYELAQSATLQRYDNVISDILSKSNKAKVVILFCNWGEMAQLLEAADRANAAGKIIFIGSDDWTTNTYYMNSSNYVAEGSLYFQLHGEYVADFDDYFTTLTPYNVDRRENPWFNESWEANFNCKLPPAKENVCDRNLRWTNLTGGFIQGRKIIYVINAVYAYAHALHKMHKDLCGGAGGLCASMSSINGQLLLKYLLQVNFQDIVNRSRVQFDRKGDIKDGGYDIDNLQEIKQNYISQIVGIWTSENLSLSEAKIQWPIGNISHIVKSECSQPCQPGLFKVIKDTTCCWICTKCVSKQYFNYSLSQCIDCPVDYWPHHNRTSCVQVAVTHINFGEATSIILVIFATLGITFVTYIFSVYRRYNTHLTIKASGRELCYCIMASSVIISINCLTPILKPTIALCIWFRIAIGLSFSLCYGSLLVKTTRIYRIFRHSKFSIRPSFTSPKSQIFFVITIVVLRLLIVLIWIGLQPPVIQREYYNQGEEIHLKCKDATTDVIVSTSIDGTLIILCTVFAFLTRHLPENYNEARFINFSMFAVIIVWLAFISAYFTFKVNLQPVVFAITSYVSVMATLLFVFVPKLYDVFSNRKIAVPTHNSAVGRAAAAAAHTVLGQRNLECYESVA